MRGSPGSAPASTWDGRETHVVEIPGKSDPIPAEVDESRLSKSANAEIPGNVVQPGLEMVIEVDPDGTLDPELGVAKRVPETGRMAVDVRTMPLFDLTLIPFVWTQTQDFSIVDLVEAMAADPENHEMLWDTRTLLPIGDFAVTAHEPVLSSSNDANTLFKQTKAIRAMEGGTGHYKGMMAPPVHQRRRDRRNRRAVELSRSPILTSWPMNWVTTSVYGIRPAATRAALTARFHTPVRPSGRGAMIFVLGDWFVRLRRT